jgi:hypothetical protein
MTLRGLPPEVPLIATDPRAIKKTTREQLRSRSRQGTLLRYNC